MLVYNVKDQNINQL